VFHNFLLNQSNSAVPLLLEDIKHLSSHCYNAYSWRSWVSKLLVSTNDSSPSSSQTLWIGTENLVSFQGFSRDHSQKKVSMWRPLHWCCYPSGAEARAEPCGKNRPVGNLWDCWRCRLHCPKRWWRTAGASARHLLLLKTWVEMKRS